MGNRIVLSEILEPEVKNLPDEYRVFDKKFSEGKTLYDFQEEALLYAMAGMKKFFGDLWDQNIGDEISRMQKAKLDMWDLYKTFMGKEADSLHFDFQQIKNKDPLFADMVQQYLGIGEDEFIRQGRKSLLPFWHFSNRMSFWMATGSGKTLIIVSLIDALFKLMDRGLIPKRNILFLTVRDDLISQFKRHVEEFQNYHGSYFELVSLKEYGKAMQSSLSFQKPVFYYRADNLSDQRGDKRIDFRDYEADGKWYVILDEAHKGDKEASKRQYIFSVMARNGFLFNFSATFDDPRDIVTTAYEYNLSTFIQNGHGKHIFVFDENVPIRGGKKQQDFQEDTKKKIILKMLILLAALRKHYAHLEVALKQDTDKALPPLECYKQIVENYIQPEIYHMPLGMVLVHSITGKEDKNKELRGWETSDMRLFLKLLIDIISRPQAKVDEAFAKLIEEAWRDLYNSISKDRLIFDKNGKDVDISKEFLNSICEINERTTSCSGGVILKNIYRYVFNTDSPGGIEIIIPKQNSDKEILLKVKTTSTPFALIRVGAGAASDLKKWLVEEMGYEENTDVTEPSYFENLNDKPEISLLLGSRAFYEGWDSSRPNIIMFIGMGSSKDRKKFILQAVGRGVRIEPLKDKRMRRFFLCKKETSHHLCKKLYPDDVFPIETLYVWGTNPEVIADVMESMEEQKKVQGYLLDFIEENVEAEEKRWLFVPVYKPKKAIIPETPKVKFKVSEQEFEGIKALISRGVIDKDFLLFHFFGENRGIDPAQAVDLFFKLFRGNLDGNPWLLKEEEDENSTTARNALKLIDEFFNHVAKVAKLHSMQVDIDAVGNRITHFKQIRVMVKDKSELEKIKSKYEEALEKGSKLKTLEGEIDRLINQGKTKEVKEKTRQLVKLEEQSNTVEVEVHTEDDKVAKLVLRRDLIKHYYLPIVIGETEKVRAIKNAINHKSEIEFIEDLSNKPEELDEMTDGQWKFSKIVERIDDIYIPYFEEAGSGIKKFYPDFIFWLKKGNRTVVVFVDPKGTEHTSANRKIDGYRSLFTEDGKPKIFKKNNQDVLFLLYLYPPKHSKHTTTGDLYRDYWVNNISEMLEKIRPYLEP